MWPDSRWPSRSTSLECRTLAGGTWSCESSSRSCSWRRTMLPSGSSSSPSWRRYQIPCLLRQLLRLPRPCGHLHCCITCWSRLRQPCPRPKNTWAWTRSPWSSGSWLAPHCLLSARSPSRLSGCPPTMRRNCLPSQVPPERLLPGVCCSSASTHMPSGALQHAPNPTRSTALFQTSVPRSCAATSTGFCGTTWAAPTQGQQPHPSLLLEWVHQHRE
mmetsp:Transcript_16378/g.48006  ORF Transcript_16378/g.48006 Transcript_16378/m.48006 type:complete len:216 (-) Transcript_16378:93-740(-)